MEFGDLIWHFLGIAVFVWVFVVFLTFQTILRMKLYPPQYDVVDDETVLFESSVIAQYVNEITGGDLLSSETEEKYRQLAWMEFASQVIGSFDDLQASVSSRNIHGVIVITSQALPRSLMQTLMQIRMSGTRIYGHNDFYERFLSRLPVYNLDQDWLALSHGFDLLHNPIGLRLKRYLDLLIPRFEAFEDLETSTILDCLKDWMDAKDDDAITGLNGAESDYYENLEPPSFCRNGPITHPAELSWIKGVTPALFYGIEDIPGLSQFVTIYGMHPQSTPSNLLWDGKININTDSQTSTDKVRMLIVFTGIFICS